MATKQQIKTKMNQLRKLAQYRDYSEPALREAAIKSIEEKQEKPDWIGLEVKEKKKADQLYQTYLKYHELESFADRQALQHLVWLEMMAQRLQERTHEAYTKENSVVDTKAIESYQTLLKDQSRIKKELGISEEKKVETGFAQFQKLGRKFKKWLLHNQAARFRRCPHCSKMILFRIRPEAWELQKFPFFQDRFFGNIALIKAYKQEKLTKEDISDILEVSPDYIDWLISKWPLHPDWDKIETPQEEVSTESASDTA